MTNALAYDGVELITAVKSFIVQVQVNSNEDEVNFFETVVGRRPSVFAVAVANPIMKIVQEHIASDQSRKT